MSSDDTPAAEAASAPLRRRPSRTAALRPWLLLALAAAAVRPGACSRGAPPQPSALAAGGAKTARGLLPAASAASASASAAPAAPQSNATAAPGAGAEAAAAGPEAAADAAPAPEPEAWETSFAWGLYYSKLAVDGPEPSSFAWAFDGRSAAAVPSGMLRAEVHLLEGTEAAPVAKQKEKKAELALRMYYHAKWLAERNYERAAEWRYREACRLAREAKRSVLAAHSMSRLGYFLMHWARIDEAREVLRESERLNTKSNPLGPFLYGVLERRTAGGDLERLSAAETRILEAGQQPSEELEAQRLELARQIRFWRAAEASPGACADGNDAVEVLTCWWMHLVAGLASALR